MENKYLLIGTLIFGVIGIFGTVRFVYCLIKQRFDVEPSAIKPEPIRVVERKKEIQRPNESRRVSYAKRENTGKVLDHTKHRNLQPGNIKTIQEVINKTIHNVDNFEHKFFGTVLEVEGRALIDSLPKKLHSFEVLDGVCYIDGQVVKIHPDDIVRLARSIE